MRLHCESATIMVMKKTHRARHSIQSLQVLFLLVFVFSIFLAVANLQTIREFFSRASGETADLIVDVQSIQGPLPQPWRNLAQGGEAHDWDLGPIVPSVKALEPEYIRIDHVYDFFNIVQRDGGNLRFDFSKLDAVLDDILATGAKPFISLSYMPPSIASSDIVSQPNNWGEWQQTVQRTIEHVSGTRGISDVYYEVWNEPDLFGGWKMYGDRSYVQMYSASARGAAAARGVRPFKFGGAATTALYKNWFVGLLKVTSENNLRMDFFSWHRYDRKLERFQQDIDEANTWLSDFPQYTNLELIISEWGHTPEVDAGYDTNFSAVHTAAASIVMAGEIDRAFVFEIEDGKHPGGQERWGRWGVLTHQSFGAQQKPRYQALRLMNRLQGSRLEVKGQGSWVKALASMSTPSSPQVLIANYDAAGRNAQAVPLTFTNILPGEYQLRQTFLGGRTNHQTIATESAIFKTTVSMPVNSVAVVELIPQFATESAQPLPPVQVKPDTIRTGFGRLLE